MSKFIAVGPDVLANKAFHELIGLIHDTHVVRDFQCSDNKGVPWKDEKFGKPYSRLDEVAEFLNSSDNGVVGVVQVSLIPHIEYLREQVEDLKVIYIYRNKEDAVNTYMEKSKGYSAARDALEDRLMSGWYYLYYPKYRTDTSREAWEMFWDDVDDQMSELGDHVISVEDMVDQGKLDELYDFLEIKDTRREYPLSIFENDLTPFESNRKNYQYINENLPKIFHQAHFHGEKRTDIKAIREEDEKYTTIVDYEIDVYENTANKINFDPKYDITLAYIAWDDPVYLKFAYLSILSQLIYTDIQDIKPVVLVDSKLYQDAISLFDGLKVPVYQYNTSGYQFSDRIGVPVTNRINKYIMASNPLLRETELLLISDCDSFVFGKQTPIYKKIWEAYKQEDQFPVLMCKENTPNRSVFLERRESLARMMYDDEEYIQWVCRRLNLDVETFKEEFVYSDHWWLSCWIMYDNTKFSSEHWKTYSDWSAAYSMWCDETIYLTYSYQQGSDIEDLSYIDGLEYVGVDHVDRSEEFWNKKQHDTLGVVHPLHGENAKNLNAQNYYNHYQERFREIYNECLENGKTLREYLSQYTN